MVINVESMRKLSDWDFRRVQEKSGYILRHYGRDKPTGKAATIWSCTECKRNGHAYEIYKAMSEIEVAIFFDQKTKKYVCPFCNEGFLEKSKEEGESNVRK